MFDFEKLREETNLPRPISEEAKQQRLATLERLASLGIMNDLIAITCNANVATVENWRSGRQAPTSVTARTALDRLGPIITHMEDNLGLNDRAIATFLTEEPHILPEDREEGFYGRWDESRDAFEVSPLMTSISTGSTRYSAGRGIEAFQERLHLRFAGHEAEAQAGVVATPETVV